MRTKYYCLLLALIFSGALFAQSNGLYMLSDSVSGTPINTVDNKVCYINKDKKIKISKAFVFSINNENSEFHVELIIPVQLENSWPVLCIRKKFFQCSSVGSSNGIQSVSFRANRQQAEEIAKALNTTCNLRKHFGQVLNFEFKPMRDDYKAGDSVYVRFIIGNLSDVSVWYNSGGMYRNSNGRCDYFDFDVYYNGILLPDEGPEWNFGGLEAHPELKPGDSDTIVECISKWSHFKTAGTYTVKCSYRLHLQNEWNNKNYPKNQEDLHKAWDEKAEKTIEIMIQ